MSVVYHANLIKSSSTSSVYLPYTLYYKGDTQIDQSMDYEVAFGIGEVEIEFAGSEQIVS